MVSSNAEPAREGIWPFTRGAVSLVALVYPPVALVVAAVFHGTGATAAALLLTGIYGVAWAARWPAMRVVVSIVVALVLPHSAADWLNLYAPILVVPALGCVDVALRGRASLATARQTSRTPALTQEALPLFVLFFALLLVAAFLQSAVLALSVVLMAGWCVAMAGRAALRMRHGILHVTAETRSLGAGKRLSVQVLADTSRCHGCHVYVEGVDPQTRVAPHEFTCDTPTRTLQVDVSPALSGPTEIGGTFVVVDGRGLVAVRQRVELLRLDVVPRARMATKAAQLYLEGGGQGSALVGETTSGAVQQLAVAFGGVEYVTSRVYVPGDSVRLLDWKHTAKLQHLVVREFEEDRGSSGVLAFNRIVSDVDQADRAVSELVSAALTAARMGLSASIADYSDGGMSGLSPRLRGRDLVRSALEVSSRIEYGPRHLRFLRVHGVQDVRGALARLRGLETGSGRKLREILELEEEALRAAVQEHPLTAVLRRVAPEGAGWVLVISSVGHDAAAAATGLRRLQQVGVRTLLLDVGGHP